MQSPHTGIPRAAAKVLPRASPVCGTTSPKWIGKPTIGRSMRINCGRIVRKESGSAVSLGRSDENRRLLPRGGRVPAGQPGRSRDATRPWRSDGPGSADRSALRSCLGGDRRYRHRQKQRTIDLHAREDYHALGEIGNVRRYGYFQTMRNLVESGHYGPWESGDSISMPTEVVCEKWAKNMVPKSDGLKCGSARGQGRNQQPTQTATKGTKCQRTLTMK